MSVCLVRQVPAALPVLLPSSSGRLPGLMADSCYWAHPDFKCSVQKFLHNLTPGSSYDVLVPPPHFCQFPSVFDYFLAAIFI